MYTPTASMSKVSGTTAYDANDLIANSGTAGSVTPLEWAVGVARGTAGHISRIRVAKSSNVATQASFKIHLFSVSPVVTNGDNGAFAVSTAEYYLCDPIAADMTTGAASGTAYLFKSFAITNGCVFKFPQLNSKIYGLIQAIGTYTPTSGETFKITLEIL